MGAGPLGRVAAYLIALLAALPAFGQSWQANTADDGVTYYGGAAYRNGLHIVDVFCGGRSPQNRPFPADHSGDYEYSSPGLLKIRIDHSSLPWLDTFNSGPQQGVVWVIGTTGYQMPPMGPDALWGGLVIELQPGDGFFEGLTSGQPMEIRFPGGQVIPLAATGLAGAMTQVQSFCAPYLGATPQAAPQVDLVAAAEAFIFRTCSGQASATPNYLMKGDLDNDGREDVVVSFQEITCPGNKRPPICGASLCSTSVFLSRSWKPGDAPYDILGMSSVIVQRPGGGLMVSTGGNFSMCPDQSKPCRFDYGWTGERFDLLN